MGKDRKFKRDFEIDGFTKISLISLDENKLGNFYQPDLMFEKEGHIIICEHSSTGDRKVHIGELTQFIAFVIRNNNEYNKFSYFLFLDGMSKNSPTVEQETARLKHYYDNALEYALKSSLPTQNPIENIRVIRYSDLKNKTVCIDELKTLGESVL